MRLHTPGIALDAKGVALGARGLVLLASIDRLVAWLAVYTRERSLDDLLSSLAIRVVSSKLGTREIALEVAAESSERMDRIAETARLVGGYTFTGASRHFVQYRDAAAPFGYDAAQLLATDNAFALYHDKFTQTYDIDRSVDLRALLLRLMPQVEPSTRTEPGIRFVVAEQGLGPALVHYFVRSHVEGEVCVAEWPPATVFDDAPVRRWVMRIPDLPGRMRPMLHATPGITCFVPAGAGVAVEAGYRHPVELRACNVFGAAGLVLVRGRGDEPWAIDRLPAMGALAAFARVELRAEDQAPAAAAKTGDASAVRVPLRVVPSIAPPRKVTATWIGREQLPLLRRLAYALPYATIAGARIAVTASGAFVRSSAGIEAIPLGAFFVEIHPRLFVPAGHEVVPAVAPEVLARAIGALETHAMFIGTDARATAIEESAFVPLETALLEAPPWESAVAEAIESALDEAPIDLRATSIGLRPTSEV